MALIAAVSAASDAPQSSRAQFYIVGSDGRSLPDPAIRRAPPAPRAVAARPMPRPVTTRIVVNIAKTPPADDPFAEFRCEQGGFYYTNDGRCVVPAWPRRMAR